MSSLPTAAQMMEWIATIVAQGIRRPGYPADRWVEEWAAARLSEFGIAEVQLESVELPYWEPRRAELRLGDESFTGFPLPHAAGGDVEGELVREGGVLAGRIAVAEVELLRMPQSGFRLLATATHDPDGDFDTLEQVLPFGARFREVMDPAIAAGAAGFVGLLTGFPWETRDYYVPYDAIARPIPGLWLSAADGRRVLARLQAGAPRGRLTIDVRREPVTSHNVVGVLPGRSDEWVIIASHHDAPWASAVEDASGIGERLTCFRCRTWGRGGRHPRLHRPPRRSAAARRAGGALVVHQPHRPPRGRRRRRARRARPAPLAHPAARRLRSHADHRRRPFPSAGVPLVHFLTAPMYLFDSCDTLDKIDVASLEPVGRAVIDIIAATAGVSAAAMRAGVAA